MNAVDFVNVIKSRLKGIAEAIAFYYGEKYEYYILDKVSKLDYYVYDNYYTQTDRIQTIELVDIAKSFAKDISLNLNVNEERKEQIENILAYIIVECDQLSDMVGINNIKTYVKHKLSVVEEFKNDLDRYSEELVRVVSYYKNDYKVKEYQEILNGINDSKQYIRAKSIEYKRDIMSEIFKLEINDSTEVEEYWKLLDSFSPKLYGILESTSYSDEIKNQQMKVYLELGCIGSTYEEVIEDAKKRNVLITKDAYEKAQQHYINRYNSLIKDETYKYTNYESILDDLHKKEYESEEDYNRIFLNSSRYVHGCNMYCFDKYDIPTSFVVFVNNLRMYSGDFDETCIHEIIHHLGGIDLSSVKRGLDFDNDERFLCLEEAYVNCVSKHICDYYLSKHDHIVKPRIKENMISQYDCTLQYMEEVLKLYGDALINIHLSCRMNLAEAEQLCPITKIANSIYRIINSSEDKEKIAKEEIEKLVRGAKRWK